MSFKTQQKQLGIGFQKQTALQTINGAGQFWKIGHTNGGFGTVGLNFEDDAADFGKGHEFATDAAPASKDASFAIEKRLTSEFAAWMFAFGLGTANMTTATAGTSGTKYTFAPSDVCDGIELDAFTVVEQLGVGCPGGAGLDRAAIGAVINDWKVSFTSGPGRNTTVASVNAVGCDKTAEPSGVTLPDPLVEHDLKGSSAMIEINDIDYVANRGLMSLEMTFSNNVMLDDGYFIGSGTQDGAAIRGRMEHGTRAYGLSFVARLQSGSPELAALKAGTTGTATVTLTGPQFEAGQNHKMTVSYPLVKYSAVQVGDANGVATVNVTVTPLYHPTNGIVSAEVICTTPGIGS